MYFFNCDLTEAISGTAKEFEPNLYQFLDMNFETCPYAKDKSYRPHCNSTWI